MKTKEWQDKIQVALDNLKEFTDVELVGIIMKLVKESMEVQHEATRSACANEVFTHRNIILSVKQPSV